MGKYFYVVLLGIAVIGSAFCDSIELNSGDIISGKVSSYDSNQTVIETKYGVMSIPNIDIRKIAIEPKNAKASTASIPIKGLVVELLMNGSPEDSSGNENHGTAIAVSSTTNRFGNADQALRFNGLSSEIKIDNKAIDWSEGFALSVWARKTGNADKAPDSTIVLKAANSSGRDEFRIWARDSSIPTVGIWSKTSSSTYQTESTSAMTGWTHIVAQIVNGKIEIYLNGKLENVAPYSGTMVSTNSTIRVGNGNWYNGDYRWEGDIDNLRIYNRSLSIIEINALYKEEK